MRGDEQCGRRAAAGEAGAANLAERGPLDDTVWLRGAQDEQGHSVRRAMSCRAGFAGRGTPFAHAPSATRSPGLSTRDEVSGR